VCQSARHQPGAESLHDNMNEDLLMTGADDLWNLALVREYGFLGQDADDTVRKQSIHSSPERDSFLVTQDVFTAPTSFISWKHWRKIEARHAHHYAMPDDFMHLNHSLCSTPCGRIDGPYHLRAAALWKTIEEWCDDERMSGALGPRIKSTLVPGIDIMACGIHQFQFQDNDINAALIAIYSFYSGQRERNSTSDGFFGGYFVSIHTL
jgi:hypothetical protein